MGAGEGAYNRYKKVSNYAAELNISSVTEEYPKQRGRCVKLPRIMANTGEVK